MCELESIHLQCLRRGESHHEALFVVVVYKGKGSAPRVCLKTGRAFTQCQQDLGTYWNLKTTDTEDIYLFVLAAVSLVLVDEQTKLLLLPT